MRRERERENVAKTKNWQGSRIFMEVFVESPMPKMKSIFHLKNVQNKIFYSGTHQKLVEMSHLNTEISC